MIWLVLREKRKNLMVSLGYSALFMINTICIFLLAEGYKFICSIYNNATFNKASSTYGQLDDFYLEKIKLIKTLGKYLVVICIIILIVILVVLSVSYVNRFNYSCKLLYVMGYKKRHIKKYIMLNCLIDIGICYVAGLVLSYVIWKYVIMSYLFVDIISKGIRPEALNGFYLILMNLMLALGCAEIPSGFFEHNKL